MATDPTTTAWRRAVELSGGEQSIEGPLKGYHHETYVLPFLPTGDLSRTGRWKCRDPRSGLFWFDRRCFESEEALLGALSGRISRIPEVVEVEGAKLQQFIEGSTLGSLAKRGKSAPSDLTGQLGSLFREMAEVRPDSLSIARKCTKEDQAPEGDSAEFLERLIRFTEKQVYEKNLERFGGLFGRLGLDGEAFTRLRKHVLGLVERPFCLLHADLHRENLIVDRSSRLWVIDWELAMFGDPLYDLATHLYLMRYPEAQVPGVITSWRRSVEDVRAGSSQGWEKDLPLLIDFKKAQSVYTDVIRSATKLSASPARDSSLLWLTAVKLRGIVAAAAVPLGLETVPSVPRIADMLARWLAGAEE
ncbi:MULTISPECIES: aminoglycoside phosphotransferase family protein [unclassified Streptomyces]|uniref:aminoglycoside phosphotransferase family protein n=1 Tax=unclassified Streptomyces TaxID=2593676 RepID=UPI002DDAA496|nr:MULTISPECIES: aminoglycoside phosphotransferase family protein [unclassified Streptomyces]WSD97490.1 aminoglycoside phosphotransferase family protein [Streptomyces sp. NBC_01474]